MCQFSGSQAAWQKNDGPGRLRRAVAASSDNLPSLGSRNVRLSAARPVRQLSLAAAPRLPRGCRPHMQHMSRDRLPFAIRDSTGTRCFALNYRNCLPMLALLAPSMRPPRSPRAALAAYYRVFPKVFAARTVE